MTERNEVADFAIIKTGGKQYKVSEGDTLKVEKIAEDIKKLELTDLLDGKKVTASVLGEGKRAKIVVLKQHPKKGYKRVKGHRQTFSEIKIDKIG